MAWSTFLKLLAALAVLAAVSLRPIVALACAVCGAGFDASSNTYVLSTALLSFIPLGMIGGVIYFVIWRVRQGPPPP